MNKLLRPAVASTLAVSLMGVVSFAQQYNQTNLVSSTSDSDLINPWGVSRSSSSPWWISDNGTGVATLYNGAGTKQGLRVTIPAAVSGKTGSPTGTIFNGSKTDFLIAPGAPAVFLFSTIDGTIAGWNPAVGVAKGVTPPSTNAVTVVKTKDGSEYRGLTSAYINGLPHLYVANFSKGRVDVYDRFFHYVPLAADRFHDDDLPPNYVPFNVQAIGNDIVVTYALHESGNQHETDGPGLGFVDIYNSVGQELRRLEHGEWLNAPWGVALAPLDFGFFSHDLLIGQFAGGGNTQSSGYIAAYDLANGHFQGLLKDASGNPIAINGLWAISPGNASPGDYDPAGAPSGELYFTAGPNMGSGGLFGYLTALPADLLKGNDQ